MAGNFNATNKKYQLNESSRTWGTWGDIYMIVCLSLRRQA